ncbi:MULTISPECIES: peptidylprolyl isomerase [unclassified Cellvibrio]|jgi:peptidyl-prolyl cis-trans isomerase A (cyclophilin A)|uniref:peptidylprolyl isomerase n=1 Tax=unclassified Cellvibrio TaxID=2624793 RepID=UPI00058AE0EA|nr:MULTISPECIES: peptidylprolyl isomerase [unclassified Cellvibrio]QEY13046.1 peptidyl-prolyl cis-trans isomerase [Cellvibrio sp. KY-YJ-3]UUA73699.1 peptidylprolyl isomerase [Cellvibrio sp. QJXJ]
MTDKLTTLFASLVLLLSANTFADNNLVAMKTDLGTFVIEVYPKSAPETVKNFLHYVDSKFYEGTIFHRVVPGFVVQGGGMTFDFTEKPTAKPVINESMNGLPNDYRSVAMARQSDPDSATAQFYINLKNNSGLNATETKPGYTVFGKVVAGMEVIEKISQEPLGMFKAYPEAPNYAVRVLSATRINSAEAQSIIEKQRATKPSSIKDAVVPVDE